MIPDSTIFLLAAVYATCACSSAGILYWMYHPAQVAVVARRAFKLIVSVLSYPLVLVAIILLHAFTCVSAMVRYTAGRVAGLPMNKIKVTVTFDE